MRWVLPLAIAAAVLVSACGGGDNGAPTASPTPTATSQASASPTAPPSASANPTPSPGLNLITRGPDIEFPENMAMIIESGCWGCDGGPDEFARVYRDASGTIRTEPLVAALKNSLPKRTIDTPDGPQEYPAFVNGEAMTQDASVMAVSFCYVGTCAFSGLNGYDANSQGVAYRSLDGGITWQEVGRGGPVFSVSAVLTDGRVLVGHGAQDDGVLDYALLPDNTTVTAPTDGAYPVTISNQILWGTSDGRLLLPDGSEFFAPSEPDPNRYYRSVLGSLSSGLEKGSALVY